MTTEKRLREAIEGGEVLKIAYYGGSQPGAVRDIAPISVKNGKVRARCYSSNAVKSFVIGKIKVVEGQEKLAAEWNPDTRPVPRYESLIELLEKERSFLSDLGWHIENGKDRVSLHRRFKNGKPMKGSDASLDYEEFTYDLVVGLDGELHEEDMRKRQRPWSVKAKNQDTRTFGSLEKAAEVFMECATLLAPGVASSQNGT